MASVLSPTLKQGRAARLRRNWRVLLPAVVCVVAAASLIWVTSFRRSDNSGQALRELEAQESQPVPGAKQEDELSPKPAPPQPDRVAAVRAEIEALEKESIEIAETLIQDYPNRSDPLGVMGMVYNRWNRTAKALEYWERAWNRNPNRPDLYDAMATLALRKGEYEKAAELCRKGLGISAQMPELRRRLAEALNGLGRSDVGRRKPARLRGKLI